MNVEDVGCLVASALRLAMAGIKGRSDGLKRTLMSESALRHFEAVCAFQLGSLVKLNEDDRMTRLD